MERQSNIELLRILAMFMILLGHAWYHYEQGLPEYPFKEFAYRVINPLLYMHVDIFVLITGYFGLRCRISTIYKFYFICLFYVFFSLIFSLVFPEFGSFHYKALLFPLTRTDWWFITVYLMLLLVSPILNAVINRCNSRKKWWYLMGISFVFNFYFSWFHKIDSVYAMGYDLYNFSCLYILGRYVSIKGISFSVKKLVVIFAFLCIAKIVLSELSLLSEPIERLMKVHTYHNPLNVFSALVVLCLFLQWKRGWYNKWVNYIASSTLSVYLITDNQYVRGGVKQLTRHIFNSMPDKCLYLPFYMVILIGIFLLCITIDKIRIMLMSPLVDKVCKWIKGKRPDEEIRFD